LQNFGDLLLNLQSEILNSDMTKLVIFISGRGSNMEAILQSCETGVLNGNAQVQLVFSDKNDAAGLQTAKRYKIQTAHLSPKGKKRADFDTEVSELLNNFEFDFIILAGYMRILTDDFVSKYPRRILNIHPADTTVHQGLHGYEWALEHKLQYTKITVHYVDSGLDTGEIIGQAEVDLTGAETLEEVEKRGLEIEHRFYPEMILSVL